MPRKSPQGLYFVAYQDRRNTSVLLLLLPVSDGSLSNQSFHQKLLIHHQFIPCDDFGLLTGFRGGFKHRWVTFSFTCFCVEGRVQNKSAKHTSGQLKCENGFEDRLLIHFASHVMPSERILACFGAFLHTRSSWGIGMSAPGLRFRCVKWKSVLS